VWFCGSKLFAPSASRWATGGRQTRGTFSSASSKPGMEGTQDISEQRELIELTNRITA
jgi:hypothetical protein